MLGRDKRAVELALGLARCLDQLDVALPHRAKSVDLLDGAEEGSYLGLLDCCSTEL